MKDERRGKAALSQVHGRYMRGSGQAQAGCKLAKSYPRREPQMDGARQGRNRRWQMGNGKSMLRSWVRNTPGDYANPPSCDLGQGSRLWLELPGPRDSGADGGVASYAAAALLSTNCARLVFR